MLKYIKVNGYYWDKETGKLDCSLPGSGCQTPSTPVEDMDSDNLFVLQLLKLIDIGSEDLNSYFIEHDESKLFPQLYESKRYNLIKNGDNIVKFEFPYLIISDGNSNIINIDNYDNIVEHQDIIDRVMAGGYSYKASFSTTSGTVWKCLEPGDNCKVSLMSYNSEWLANNPKYMFAPTQNSIVETEISKDGSTTTVVAKYSEEEVYAIQY